MFREICSFDPLSLQKVVIMAPFLEHMVSSQQFYDKQGTHRQF